MTTTRMLPLLLPLLLGPLGACAPADVAGEYTLALTNRENGCSFDNWTVGNSISNVPMTLTQASGSATVSGTISGAAGLYLEFVLGTRMMVGEVGGAHVRLTLNGTRSYRKNNCAYTVIARFDGDLDGDAIRGQIDYTSATNASPDCGPIEGCHSVQEFNGTRPPRP